MKTWLIARFTRSQRNEDQWIAVIPEEAHTKISFPKRGWEPDPSAWYLTSVCVEKDPKETRRGFRILRMECELQERALVGKPWWLFLPPSWVEWRETGPWWWMPQGAWKEKLRFAPGMKKTELGIEWDGADLKWWLQTRITRDGHRMPFFRHSFVKDHICLINGSLIRVLHPLKNLPYRSNYQRRGEQIWVQFQLSSMEVDPLLVFEKGDVVPSLKGTMFDSDSVRSLCAGMLQERDFLLQKLRVRARKRAQEWVSFLSSLLHLPDLEKAAKFFPLNSSSRWRNITVQLRHEGSFHFPFRFYKVNQPLRSSIENALKFLQEREDTSEMSFEEVSALLDEFPSFRMNAKQQSLYEEENDSPLA